MMSGVGVGNESLRFHMIKRSLCRKQPMGAAGFERAPSRV